jgi:hypothetical protein
MRIAAIVVTYNDDYKFKEWIGHHEVYRSELYKHIIVDNGSTPVYVKMVEAAFTDSIIIKRKSNGGCTGAYNDGIRLALTDPNVDAIMLIGNDMKLEPGGIINLGDFLCSNPKFGMVAPVILHKDSNIVAEFGDGITYTLRMNPFDYGQRIEEIKSDYRIVLTVCGGMNLSKREFYEKVGLQDETLFMYSDEVDMGLRAIAHGFLIASTKDVVSWHQHINENKKVGKRHPFSMYLIARNKIYLAQKHYGIIRKLIVFFYYVFTSLKSIIIMLLIRRFNYVQDHLWSIMGALNGLIGNMKHNRFTKNI